MKTALLIVDIQNDFLPGGALAVPGGDEIIPAVNELMPEYDLVVATQDWHPADHGSFATNHDGRTVGETIDLHGIQQILWPDHAVEGSRGADFAPGLDVDRIDHVIRKGTDRHVDSYSGFFDNGGKNPSGLTAYLRGEKITDIHVVGLATDYCVKFTVLDAIAEGFRTTLIQDAARGVDLQPGDVEQATEACRIAGARIAELAEILGETVDLYRPVGPDELRLLEEADFRAWPPRLPEQPIFYPVTNAAYAEQITREWNLPEDGRAYVTRFTVNRRFLSAYPRKVVGGRQHEELWIPAEDLDDLNANLIGPIEVITRIEPKPPATP